MDVIIFSLARLRSHGATALEITKIGPNGNGAHYEDADDDENRINQSGVHKHS